MAIPFFRRLLGRTPTVCPEANEPAPISNDADAQFQLGLKRDQAADEDQDCAAAAQCYLKAAEQNHARAEFHLGLLYAEGRGVTKDETQATLWIRKAAQQGLPAAQFTLGMRLYRTVICSRSKDLPESRIEAYKWFHLAALQEFPDSETFCNRMILSMSRDEVVAGNKLASAFVVEHSEAATATL